jgi:hypothetical protein
VAELRAIQQEPVPSFGQYEAWVGADLMIKGIQMAGKNPTRPAVIKDLRSLKSYDVNGLLPQPLDFATDFGHDPKMERTWMMQAKTNGFVQVSAKPFCGHDIQERRRRRRPKVQRERRPRSSGTHRVPPGRPVIPPGVRCPALGQGGCA